MIKKTIGRFGPGPRAASLRQGRQRSSIKIARQGAESPPQPGLPQGGAAELFLGPVGGRWGHRGSRGRGQAGPFRQPLKQRPKILLQRVDQIELLPPARLVAAVLTATPAGEPDDLPVGGAITGAWETRALDKGLNQHRTVAVTLLPIVSQASQH